MCRGGRVARFYFSEVQILNEARFKPGCRILSTDLKGKRVKFKLTYSINFEQGTQGSQDLSEKDKCAVSLHLVSGRNQRVKMSAKKCVSQVYA